MSLLETPALADRAMDAFIARLEERMRPPDYYFDMRGKIFDIFLPPEEVPLPCISVTMLPEEIVTTVSSGSGGQYRIRLPILLEFRDAWHEGLSTRSDRVKLARRARAEMKRAAAGDIWLEDPDFMVTIRLLQSNVLVGGADDQISADVTVAAEFDQHVDDPFREV